MTMADVLPARITRGATLRGNEYGWTVSSFPGALASAEASGYACLGGQFQFRLEDGSTCEMYWLDADSEDRMPQESWADYSRRSCLEVLQGFRRLIQNTDFTKEAAGWFLQIDPSKALVFVAYFVTEADLTHIGTALRKAIDEGDASGIAKGNVFDRVRNQLKLSQQPR